MEAFFCPLVETVTFEFCRVRYARVDDRMIEKGNCRQGKGKEAGNPPLAKRRFSLLGA